MLEPPWRHTEDARYLIAHWTFWVAGWIWSVAGLVLGAFIAPLLLQPASLANPLHGDVLEIGIAVVAGFVVQFVGWCLMLLVFAIQPHVSRYLPDALMPFALYWVFILPLAGVGYGIHRYLTQVDTGKQVVTIAFVGGLVIKAFLAPLVKGLVTGALFAWFMRWLRGGTQRAGRLWRRIRLASFYMLEPPWRHSLNRSEKGLHWLWWIVGWTWTVAGLVLGAFIAPPLLGLAGLANAPYRDTLDIGVAVIMGFVVLFVGQCLLTAFDILAMKPKIQYVVLLPLLGVGYALYRYFAWVGPGQRLVTVAFVGGFLINTFLIPFIKNVVWGIILAGIIRWLRGDKAKAKRA